MPLIAGSMVIILPSDGRSVLSIASGAERMTLPLGIPSSREPKRSWATTRTGVRYHPVGVGREGRHTVRYCR
jgi:hypothetical protein